MENPAGDSNAPGEGEHASLFPPPPPHYKLFASGPAALQPPPAVEGEYECLGEIHTTEEGLPPLQAPPLFQASDRGTLDYRAALLQLVDELVFGYAELLDCVARRPQAAGARAVEAVGTAARNASYLLNALRPRQARLGVAAAARRDAAEWNRRAEALERAAREHDEELLRRAAEVERVCVGGGGGGVRFFR